MADTQDLFLERFDSQNPRRYLYQGEWREADVRRETIAVRGEAPVEVEVVSTHHGPVVAGNPASGHALSMRYVAMLPGNRGWDCLLPMLRARSCAELGESMRGWVDPANNFVMADVQGDIAYRTRGQVPVRNALNAWIPVPGWTGEHEWTGIVPFEAMPAQANPERGYILTANNRIVAPGFPHYLSHWYAADHRAQRIHSHLESKQRFSPQDMLSIHEDVVSRPAEQLLPLIRALEVRGPLAAEARDLLANWDGRMGADQPAALLFEALREELVAGVIRRLLGPLAGEPYTTVGNGPPSILVRLRQRIHEHVLAGDRALLGGDATWQGELASALERAVEGLREQLGDDPSAWRWGRLHQLRPAHPLCPSQPELATWLNPPGAEMGGDGDTVQAAGYQPATGYTVTLTSVARYLFDLSDWDRSAWIVPYGVSGHPGSPHYADQTPDWREHRLQPMYFTWERIATVSQARQTLVPRP
jgi:penicillin amidase